MHTFARGTMPRNETGGPNISDVKWHWRRSLTDKHKSVFVRFGEVSSVNRRDTPISSCVKSAKGYTGEKAAL